ncbi:MAG: tRNA uridine(34) 5-carboxymethylaminomethyl modification radical SAM/GNAT enzyme Elp3 [Candidatus Gracilibacteria bacterium]|nr:tRNA uridine(34) 5-carboxymethylaminomethyl modification radical SAM/GNAT enzyme Elp3 [Candidatus Gracilibacteria bacterium]
MIDIKNQILDEIILEGVKLSGLNKEEFHKLKNNVYKNYDVKKPFASIEFISRYNELVKNGTIEINPEFQKLIRKRGVRSLSGVTVISLLTKFWGCPGKCVYCPTFDDLPKSYIPNEPAVQRAQLNEFDPILQIHNRLRALEVTGHKIEKNDIRIIGGTWSVYPKAYREDFIKGIYDAFNTYDEMKENIEETDLGSEKFASFKLKDGFKLKLSNSLEEAKKLNETSRCRVIGIAIETRPDWINLEEIARLRRYGVTRVEIGYQTTFDEINEINKRGHGNKESIEATKLLKNAGFKVVAHMMPNLLGSTPKKDKESLVRVFDDQAFRPDELKIYPMVVTDKSELTEIWKKGGFQPYDDETLINLTADLEEMIPEYVRLNRTYRDIPASEILAGSHVSNLRQIVEEKIKKKGIHLVDIRHREIKDKVNIRANAVMNIFDYKASDGKEFFMTFEDKEDRTIFSLLRLRLPGLKNNEIYSLLPEIAGAALIREIHTFGDQLSIGEVGSTFGQHLGFGKKLIEKAEAIAIENGYEKMAVIAGVGVRGYYEKRGYHLEGEYMVKKLK